MAKLWKPKEIKNIKFALSSAVTITSAAALDTFFIGTDAFTDNVQAYAKNVTIVVPEGAIERLDLLGVDSNYFQNAELDMKPFDLGGMSGTLVLQGDEVLETFFYGTATAISTTHERYQPGKLSSAGRKEISILMNLDDALGGVTTKEVNVVLDKAYITKLGDVKIAGPDGSFEVDFNAVCLPRNFYIEFKK